MSNVHRTIIVPAAKVALARSIAAALSPAGAGMFVARLSPSGNAPATHYVSTGQVGNQFSALMADANLLLGACQAAGFTTDLAALTDLLAVSDVSDEAPPVAFARLGLSQIRSAP